MIEGPPAGAAPVPSRGSGGRLDGIDALVMLGILLLAIVSRGYRLEEPRAMYFDEVYHARTATEFLQDWRYGVPHDIYEWTHPHLAKYVMAVSIALFGHDQVVGRQDLGTPVGTALYERPWERDGDRYGDLLWVGGPDGLLAVPASPGTPFRVSSAPVTSLALDPDGHQLYAATPSGVAVLDTGAGSDANLVPLITQAGISQVALAGDGIVTLGDDGSVGAWATDGTPTAAMAIPDAVALAAAAEMRLVVAEPTQVTDAVQTAKTLADITGDDTAVLEARLGSEAPLVVLSVAPDDEMVAAIDDATSDLPGVRVETRPLVAVGTSTAGDLHLLDATTLVEVTDVPLTHPVVAMALDPDLDPATLFVGGGSSLSTVSLGDTGPVASDPLSMPGPVTEIAWDQTAELIHVATRTAADEPTIAVVEPNGLTLFADAVVPAAPAALAVVDRPDVPSAPVRVLSIAPDGVASSIDAGSNAWAWRMPGVLAGALTVLLLYLLARFVSRRRSVGLAVAGLALLEGMMFVTARIAMNDVYVTLFITAAATVFAAVWLGRWRRPWVVAVGLVGVGLLLGLALASKWVGFYAIGGVGLLLLARSALGRVLILLSLIAATAVLGAIAITPADVPDPSRDWTFLALMLGLTGLVGAAIVRRPLPFEPGELRAGGLIGIALGALGLLAGVAGSSTLIAVAGAALALGGLLAIAIGRSPAMATRVAPAPPDTPSFLRPGRRRGVPWLFALACLTVVPVAVYVVSYLPWVALGNQLVAGVPGQAGQTLLDLTRSMYEYHDQLRVAHPASSPWWAWMLDLKPVWLYLGDMAGGLTATIYDGANPLILWSSIAGLIWAGVVGWRRRDPGYALVVVMFLSLWLPWARIDRATFQYHLTSSLPFALLALALLLSAIWHRSRDGRWLVIGFGLAAAVISLALYPTLAALPVGADLGGWVTTLLPTWAYDYQFGVNLDPAVERPLLDATTVLLGIVAVCVTAGAMALASRWTGAGFGAGPHDRPDADVLRV